MTVRPTPEQVLSLAPDKAAAAAATALANPMSWSYAGCDDGAVWGNFVAASAEPYAVAVDLSDDVAGPAYRCNCPSRKLPCKHALGLLLLYANNGVVHAQRLPFAAQWLQRRVANPLAHADATPSDATVASHDGGERGAAIAGALGGGSRAPRPEPFAVDPGRTKRQLERSERMRAGLQELDRWLADRIRAGLAAPALADPDTWDLLAARLIDAQCGGLANRVKRVAAKVGQYPNWHEGVLEELAVLHLLAVGAQRSSSLPADLADGVHVATGLTVAKDDVLAGVPSTARWIVAGVSRTREDRITVQRSWLCHSADGGTANTVESNTWAMVLAFGAFGNEVSYDYEVGVAFDADVHWYPGGIALRALVGRLHTDPSPAGEPPAPMLIADGLAAAGWAIAREPWLERYPVCVRAVPAPIGNGRWVLADDTGSMPIASGVTRLAELVCASGGSPINVMGEWSTDGFLPLTMWVDGMAVVL